MKKKKKQFFQDLAAPYRDPDMKPKCPHFGTCGGCMFQDVPYQGQLLMKRDYLNSLEPELFSVEKVHPSEPFGYRNRMDFVTAFGKFGLREAGSYKFVADLSTCPLMQPESRSLFEEIREAVREVEGYNYLRHQGYLRYVVFRQARFTGQIMASFVVAKEENRLHNLVDYLKDKVDSLSLLFNDGLADTSFGREMETVKQGYIQEEFDGIKYRITPNSFFQSNSAVARQMYRVIRDHARGRVLDLFSGVGSISLFISEKAERVTGVEVVEEAVDSARTNFEINGIKNVEFHCSDTRLFLREKRDSCDTLVLDPPRAGLHPKELPLVNELGAEKILYMSCNPAAFARELPELTNYRLRWIEAWDMFPQTPHVETLTLLERV